MIKRLIASLIDEIIGFGGAAGLYFLTSFIMGKIGFEFIHPLETYLVFAIVFHFLYFGITEGCKLKATIGKKLLNCKTDLPEEELDEE